VEESCRAGGATDDNTVHAHYMLEPKATNTQSEYVFIFFILHSNNGYTNASQCCVIRILPVLIFIISLFLILRSRTGCDTHTGAQTILIFIVTKRTQKTIYNNEISSGVSVLASVINYFVRNTLFKKMVICSTDTEGSHSPLSN